MASIEARPRERRPSGFPRRPRPTFNNQTRWQTALCDNSTIAESFLPKVRELIRTLQGNSSFTKILEMKSNQIAFILNEENTALISSNCTAFFDGLRTARNQDRETMMTVKNYGRIAQRLFMKLVRSLTGLKGAGERYL